IGGVLALLGVLLSIVGIVPTIMMAWHMWYEGNAPDILMLGSWKFTLVQFFLFNDALVSVGLALLGVAIQVFFVPYTTADHPLFAVNAAA
ncbi:MAG TPA: hypothetical protein VHX44_12065, partial [Planctomycetota bacterium]|nr:hypothetical protein [Planctomycetota bacterium]